MKWINKNFSQNIKKMSNNKGVNELMDAGIKQTKDLITNLRNYDDQKQLPPDILHLLNQLEQKAKKIEEIRNSVQKETLCSSETHTDKQKSSQS
jgi:hypothetical protein